MVATAVLAASYLSAVHGTSPKSSVRGGSEADLAAIERLHDEDREATLTDSADQLAKLRDKDAVRFPMESPAEIGAAAIYADDKRWEMSSGRERTLCYNMEVQDVQIAGDWAVEWGYASGKNAKDGKVSIEYAKILRVMKKQSDGTARFARVMVLTAPSASAVLQRNCYRRSTVSINHLQCLPAPIPGTPRHNHGTPNLSTTQSRHTAP